MEIGKKEFALQVAKEIMIHYIDHGDNPVGVLDLTPDGIGDFIIKLTKKIESAL